MGSQESRAEKHRISGKAGQRGAGSQGEQDIRAQGPSLTWGRCTIEYSVMDSLSGGVDTEHWREDSSDGGGVTPLPYT